MTDIPFDTLAVAKRLEAGGFSTEKAEAITNAVHAGITGGVATKADIAGLKTDIVELRASFLWVKIIGGGMIAANIGVIAFFADLVKDLIAGG